MLVNIFTVVILSTAHYLSMSPMHVQYVELMLLF